MRFAYVTATGVTYYRRVLKGIAQFARSQGHIDIRIEYPESPADLADIQAAAFDGLILGTHLERSPQAAALRIPAISVSNTYANLPFPKVISDDTEAGRIIARHLLAKGYRHFAFWGDRNLLFAAQRFAGFASTILEHLGPSAAPAKSDYTERSFAQWMHRLPKPLALMAATDAAASDAIDRCRRLNLRIPEDVAIVGVDDDDLYSDTNIPPLSSVALQTERIGHLAAERLMRLLQGHPAPPITLVPPGPLIARQSSRALATTDPLVARAIKFLEENLARGVNVTDLSRTLGLSRRLLELRFKAAFNRSPGQELSRLRITHAQNLLATTTLPLKQIAVLSGFSGPVRMSQVFRTHTHQTPTGYRRTFLPH